MNDLAAFLAGFGCDQIYPMDGTIHRFNRNGSKTGWFWGVEAFKLESGEPYRVVIVGDWNGSERAEYRTNAVLDKSQKKEINENLRKAKLQAEIERIELQREVAERTSREFEEFNEDGVSPYLERKGISSPYGCRFDGDILLVPMRDGVGNFWGYQRIYPNGEKYFNPGQRKKGCFHAIGHPLSIYIYICEGFATGASIFQSTACYTVVAFDAGNLGPVASEIRRIYPQAKIIIAADNDQFTAKNAGLIAANGIAKSMDNCKVIYPTFKNLDTKPTDFNDLHLIEGLEQIKQQLSPATTDSVSCREIGTSNDEEYQPYKLFFEEHLKGARKDLITKEFLKFDGEYWQSPLNNLDAIKSYAMGKELSANKVQAHLDRFILEKPFELLIDIPKWDETDRIKELSKFVKFKDHDFSVFEDALKEWGANIFRRLYAHNAQNRCIILKGEQGIGKDRLIKSLMSGFKHYFESFTSNRDERECWGQVTESLVLHIEEFDQTGVMPVAFLKDLVTRDTVKYRSPYDRKAKVKKCIGSFISSVNIDDILRDETGNRRFAVFEVESIDWAYPKDWDTQIIAQFHALYLADFWAKESTWKTVSKKNEKFEQVDMVPELLDYWDYVIAEQSLRAGGQSIDGRYRSAITELSFGQLGRSISDLCKMGGVKPKKLMSILKINKRSEKRNGKMHYWSNLIKCGTIKNSDDLSSYAQKPSYLQVVENTEDSTIG